MLWGLLGAAFVLLLIVAVMYNGLIGKRNQVETVFATIDVLLKKRYDLIPNLIASVEGYMHHERETLERITALRTQAMSTQSGDEHIDLDNQIAVPLRQILLSVENYPELKANDSFLRLQASLNEVEEQISAARRAYNATVLEYNNAVDMFPTSILASMMRFSRRKFFEATMLEREPVKVAFSSGGRA